MRTRIMTHAVAMTAVTVAMHVAPASAADEFLALVTAEAPPLSVVDGDKISGTTTDRLADALTEAGIRYSISPYPWVRALAMARGEPGTCAYPTARSPDRETQYKWIGPTDVSIWTLFGRADEEPPQSLDQVKSRIIGVALGDVSTQYLKDNGFKIDESRDDALNLRKLQTGRVDYWISTLATGLFHIRQAKSEDVIPVLSFRETPIYLACNLSVSDETVEKLSTILVRTTAER